MLLISGKGKANKMKQWDNYTDKDNVDFAKGEYGNFDVGDPYKIGEGKDRRTALCSRRSGKSCRR